MSIPNIASAGAGVSPSVQSGYYQSDSKIGQELKALTQMLNDSTASNVKNGFAKLLQDLLSQTDDTQITIHVHRHHAHDGTAQAAAAGGANTILNSIQAPAAAGAAGSLHVTA